MIPFCNVQCETSRVELLVKQDYKRKRTKMSNPLNHSLKQSQIVVPEERSDGPTVKLDSDLEANHDGVKAKWNDEGDLASENSILGTWYVTVQFYCVLVPLILQGNRRN